MAIQMSPSYAGYKINTDDAFLERAVVLLYTRQTLDERKPTAPSDRTIHLNRRGFNAADASRLSYYGRWVRSGRHLTGWHLAKARELTWKYRRQVSEAVFFTERARERRALAA